MLLQRMRNLRVNQAEDDAMLRIAVTVLFVLSITVGEAAAQAPAAPNCALFTTMSEEHGKKAQAIEQDAAEQAKTLTAEAAKTNADIAARAAKSEWEMAALSREAARKCLTDFLSPNQTTTAAPATAAPVQQAAPIAAPAPVVVRQPAPVVRQAAPVVIQQPAPVVIQKAVPVPHFHSTAVSAIAAGGAALEPRIRHPGSGLGQGGQADGAPGTTTTRTTMQDGSISTTVKQPDGTELMTFQRPDESKPSVFNTTKQNPDGSETTVHRSHAKETSAVTSGTRVQTKSPSGANTETFRATVRNPDGTASRVTTTTSQMRPGGATDSHVKAVRSDGTQTEIKSRNFQNWGVQSTTTTNPDGTVTKHVTRTDHRTGAVTVLPNNPAPVITNTRPIAPATSNRPPAPLRMVGKRSTQSPDSTNVAPPPSTSNRPPAPIRKVGKK